MNWIDSPVVSVFTIFRYASQIRVAVLKTAAPLGNVRSNQCCQLVHYVLAAHSTLTVLIRRVWSTEFVKFTSKYFSWLCKSTNQFRSIHLVQLSIDRKGMKSYYCIELYAWLSRIRLQSLNTNIVMSKSNEWIMFWPDHSKDNENWIISRSAAKPHRSDIS